MALKKFRPITPSQRQLVLTDRSALFKGKPVKTLTEGLSSSGGRTTAAKTGSTSITATNLRPKGCPSIRKNVGSAGDLTQLVSRSCGLPIA